MARRTGSNGAETAARLREVALRLIARQGYAAVTMRQIAAGVGVQVGALYQHVPDKQSLLVELLEGHLQELLAAWRSQHPPDAPAARLEHFVRFHIRHHLPRRDAVFLANMELRNLAPENYARIEVLRRAYEDVLQDILAAGRRDGTFEIPDLRLATMALLAMLTGAVAWFRPSGRLSVEEIADIHADMALRAVHTLHREAGRERRLAERAAAEGVAAGGGAPNGGAA